MNRPDCRAIEASHLRDVRPGGLGVGLDRSPGRSPRLLLTLCGALAITTCAGCCGFGTSPRAGSSGAAPSTPAPTPSATAEPAPPSEASRERDFDYLLGESFDLGDFSYRVGSVERAAHVGTRLAREAPAAGASFVVVEYDETNHGTETTTVMAANAELRDLEGRRFRPSSRPMTALAMSGDGDLLVTELHPGVTRTARLVFELPSDAVQPGMTLEIRERGLLGVGVARVRLVDAAAERLTRYSEDAVDPLLSALPDHDLAAIRLVMAEPARTSTPDSALTEWCDAYVAAIAARGDRQVEILPDDIEVSPDAITMHMRFVPPRGRWQESDGEVALIGAEVGGRFRIIRIDVHPPADGDRSVGLDPAPAYTVLRETPSETAAEAQLDGRLVVGTELSGDELGAVLRDYLAEARAREGWRRHPHTTDVYAYAYASEADATGSGGGWLAMMTWAAERAEPAITLSAERIAAAAAGPEDHDSLPEDERRAIYAELMRGDAAALERAPSPDDYVAATHANERTVASRHGVLVDTVRAIGIEGVSRGW